MGHILYRPEEIRRIFSTNSPIITLLRHPLEQIQYDLHHHGVIGSTDKASALEKIPIVSQNTKLFKIPEAAHKNISMLHQYLDTVNLDFTTVGIAEYFDESLILLKRKLCWSLEDILYVNAQVMPHSAKIQPDTKTAEKHRNTNALDYAVYEYFHERLLKTLSKQEDSSFNDEFFYFRKINKLVNKFCSKFYNSLHRTLDLEQDNRILSVPSSRWNKPFNIISSDCAAMKVNNKIYQDIFLIKRYPALCNYSELFTHKHNLSGLCRVQRDTTTLPMELLFDPDSYLI